MGASYLVRVLAGEFGFSRWCSERAAGATGAAYQLALRDRIRAEGQMPFKWLGPDPAAPVSFMWACPGCGSTYAGSLGPQPASGWSHPRWVNTGTLDRPTLAPSLGCSRWRQGECDGHWWLRDGQLAYA
jgi:hypothetical protein